MPRLSQAAPKYRRHKATGQAMVTLGGRDHYLGKYNSAASKEAYRRIVSEHLVSGGVASKHSASLTVAEVLAAFLTFARSYYLKAGQPTKEVKAFIDAMGPVKRLYSRELATNFGPLALKACREEMIAAGWCRRYVNQQTDRIKRIFKWACSEELVPGSVYESLRCVAGLRRGRTRAPESKPVLPVSEAVVEATLEKLSPMLRDMVLLQRYTGARPGELCDLRPADVNRSASVWEYVVESHKTSHHGHQRVIFIGPRGQEILLPYLLRAPGDYCFSPRECDAARRAELSAQRKTPLSCGNKPGSHRTAKPRRVPGDQYTTESYGRAIRRAANLAGVPTWSPHRLRHSFATEVRKSHGLEAVQVALGHSKADVTQVYADRDFALAARVAAEVG